MWRAGTQQQPQQQAQQQQAPKLNTQSEAFVQNQLSAQKLETNSSDLNDYITDQVTKDMLIKRNIVSFFPIQFHTYNHVFQGLDLIGRDRTGSGKTLSYALPLTEKLRSQGFFQQKKKGQKPYILVLLPTRELAIQVAKEFKLLNHNDEYRAHAIYGGTMVSEQIHELKNGVEIAIGTPGRIIDMLNRRVLDFSEVKAVVLDEADQMLNMGFQEDVEKIYQFVTENNQGVQNLLFSATMPKWVEEVATQYTKKNRVMVDLIKYSENKTSVGVEHLAIAIPYHLRTAAIGDVVLCHGGHHCRTIIFTETKQEANDILLKAHIKQDCQVLHGDIPQKQREITFQGFRDGIFKCLIATNVAARGLDIPCVDLIIQLDPPKDVENYIHRAGRTARAGRTGTCVTFYTKKQNALLDSIEKKASMKFKKIGAPQPEDIIKASVRDIKEGIMSVDDKMLSLFTEGASELIAQIGPEEALKRALAYISGYTQSEQLKQRSLLSSFEGYVTFCLRTEKPVRSSGPFWGYLKNNVSEKLEMSIKSLKMFCDQKGVAFDVPEEFADELEDLIEEEELSEKTGFFVERATELPEIEDDGEGGSYQMGGAKKQQYGSYGQNKQQYGQYGGSGGGFSQFRQQNTSNYPSFGGSYGGNGSQGGNQGGSYGGNQSGSYGGNQSGSYGGNQSGSYGGNQGGYQGTNQGYQQQQQQGSFPPRFTNASKPSFNNQNTKQETERNLCLSSLSFDVDEQQISQFFSSKNIKLQGRIKLLQDQETGRSKGTAFVTCATDQDYEDMLNLNGISFMDRNIRISKPIVKN